MMRRNKLSFGCTNWHFLVLFSEVIVLRIHAAADFTPLTDGGNVLTTEFVTADTTVWPTTATTGSPTKTTTWKYPEQTIGTTESFSTLPLDETTVDLTVFTTEASTTNITGPDVAAAIAGGSSVAVLYGDNHTFDASTFTVDLSDPGSLDGFTFLWQCRRVCENWTAYDESFTLIVKNMTSSCGNDSDAVPGCFKESYLNDGTGTLYEGGSGNLTIETSQMLDDQELYIRVIAMKGNSHDVATQIMLLLTQSTPVVDILCFSNCMGNLNPFESIALCASVTNTNSTAIWWTWVLYSGSSATSLCPVPDEEWLSSSPTGKYTSCLAVDSTYWRNQSPGSVFTFQVLAQPDGESPDDVGISYYSLAVSGPVLPANCSVNPDVGVAVTTEFNVTCGEFITQNQPLSYEIGYTVDGSMYSWVRSGSDLSVIGDSLLLPLGNQMLDYSVNVSVKAQDSIGMTAYVVVTAAVYQPSISDISNMLSLLIGALDPTTSSFNFTDPQQALAFVGALAMTLNTMDFSSTNSTGNGTMDMTNQLTLAREAMTAILTQVPLDSIEAVNSVQSILASVLGNPSQVNANARDNAASVLEGSADFLSNISTSSMSSTQLDNTITQAVFTAEALLTSNSFAAENEPGMDESEDVGPRVLGVLDLLGAVLSSAMVTGDASRIVRSTSITIVVDKQFVSSLTSGPIGDSSTGNLLGVPDLWSADNSTTSEPVISTQVKTFVNSPYVARNASVSIDSSVVMLKLSGADGNSAAPSDQVSMPVHILSNRPFPEVSASATINGVAAPFHQLSVQTHKMILQPNKSIALQFDWFWNYTNSGNASLSNFSEIIDASSNYSIVVYLSVGKVPSRSTYDFNCTLPVQFITNATTNKTYISGGGVYSSRCSDDNAFSGTCQGTRVYNNLDLFPNTDPSGLNPKLCYIPASELGNTGSFIYWRVRYLTNSDLQALTNHFDASFDPPGTNTLPQIEFSATVYSPDCRFWNPFIKLWEADGCMGGPLADSSTSHCICDRLSISPPSQNTTSRSRRSASLGQGSAGISFGAGLTLTVNAPDLSHSGFNHLDDNPLIFSVMVSVMCIYFCILVWTIKRDRVDEQTASIVPLIDNEPDDKYLYEITICTGNMVGAGTSANVFIVFAGDRGETYPRTFCSNEKVVFKRGGVDTFLMAAPCALGALSYVRVWHDNTGKGPSWFLNRILVRDLQTSQQFYFVVNNWLSDKHNDCLRCRIINVAGKGDLSSFRNVFWTKTRKDLVDGHLWFSVLGRPPASRFSRTQRCTCCVTLLFTLMTANIMFYNKVATTNTVIKIGPIVISVAQVVQGIIASLVVLPINIVIVQIFRKSETFQVWQASRRRQRRVASSHESIPSVVTISQLTSPDQITNIQQILPGPVYPAFRPGSSPKLAWPYSPEKQPIAKTTNVVKRAPRKWMLPWWCTFIAYFLCLAACAVSFWYVVEIGFVLGQEAATKWLVSFITSIAESVCLSQPIKVILKAIVFAAVLKKPAHEDDTAAHRGKRDDYLEKHLNESNKTDRTALQLMRRKILIPAAPSQDSVLAAHSERKRQEGTVALLKEVGIYLVFVAAMMMASYGNLDVNSETSFRVVENTVRFAIPQQTSLDRVSLEGVKDKVSLWKWLKDTFVSSVYENCSNASAQDPITHNFPVCNGFYLVQQARLRQYRISKGSECAYPISNRTCYGDYLSQAEDTGSYEESWSSNVSLPTNDAEPWKWRSEADCIGHAIFANVGAYPGSGYVASLGNTSDSAMAALIYLEENDWIDEKSRAIMVEFAAYNPSVNLLATSFIIIELLPLGFARPLYRVTFVRYEPYLRDSLLLTLAAEIGCMILSCYFTYRELGLVKKLKGKYIRSFGHMLDMVNLLLCYVAIILFMTKVSTLEEAKTTVSQRSPGKFPNFQSPSFWNECYRSCLGMSTFVATLKFLKLLRFNSRISMFGRTLKAIQAPLLSFCAVSVIIYLGFVHSTFLVYGSILYTFSSFVSTCQQLLILILNKFDYTSLTEANPVYAPVLLLGFVSIINFFMLNVMMTIIMEGFQKTRASPKHRKNQDDVLDFMLKQFKTISGIGSLKVDQPMEEKATHADKMLTTHDGKVMQIHSSKTNGTSQKALAKIDYPLRPRSGNTPTWTATENEPDWFWDVENACLRLDKAFSKIFDPASIPAST